MDKFQGSWKSALTPQKAPTYGNQAMLIASPKELQVSNVDYVVVFEGTKKYHVAIADVVNPFTLHVVIPEHDVAEEVSVKVYICQETNLNILTNLKFTYISQMEHAVAKFLAHSVSDPEVAEKLDAVWTICLGKDHLGLWDKKLAQAFSQLELPFEWTLVGDILQQENESHETLLHFAAHHGLKELINVFLDLPGAKRALSTYDKSGLLPRDVARESGRLDIVELLDAERSTDQRKSGSFKDNSRRKVRRNNESGVATITNLRNQNVQEDIQLLREVNKLVRTKKDSPVNRHSWPIKIQCFNADDYIEDLYQEIGKTAAPGDTSNTKRSFMDENLIRLRGITEDIYNLRLRNSEETSKEISIIADQNRRPAHSRRLSCPASVERRKRSSQGIPNLQSRVQLNTTERSSQEEPANKVPGTADLVFSTPPHSPTVDDLIDLTSPTVTTPTADNTFQALEDHEPYEFMTPLSSTPPPAVPISPNPVSLKCSDVERRHNASRKGRPRTWYGGTADAPSEDEELYRRSNSLEDFAKALDASDDESATSEANSKENLLQTMSSLTEKASRTESFVSSISDLSAEKESVGSDVESEHGDDCEHECDRDTQEDIEERKGINEGGDTEGLPDYEEQEKGEGGNDEDVGVHDGISVEGDAEEKPQAEGQGGIESGDHEGIEEHGSVGDVEELDNLNQTAGSNENVENSEREDLQKEYKTEELKQEYWDANDLERDSIEQNVNIETGTSNLGENREEKHADSQDDDSSSEYENAVEEVESSVACNGVEDDIREHEDNEGHQDRDPLDKDEGVNTSESNVEDQASVPGKSSADREDEEDEQPSSNGDVHAGLVGDAAIEQVVIECEGTEENKVPREDVSSEEPSLTQSSQEEPEVGRHEFKGETDESEDQTEHSQNRPEGIRNYLEESGDLAESGTITAECSDIPDESEDHAVKITDITAELESGEFPAESGDLPAESGDVRAESGDVPAESGDVPVEPGDLRAESGDVPAESGDRPNEDENHLNEAEIVMDEDKSEETDEFQSKIKFEVIHDIECEVKDFCLPGERSEGMKQLFRIQADDVESGEDSDQGKPMQLDEKARSESPLIAEERSPTDNPEGDSYSGHMFRQRSAALLGVKAPVKRTGSDISVTSLQDVQLDVHTSSREGSISPGVLNASRKAKSFGDLSTFSEGRSERTKVDDDESEDERRRIQEDQAQLSVLNRVKKFENAAKYASNETLDHIAKSSISIEREDEEQGRRRWSNFFSAKNPKQGKKPGRAPSIRREGGLRASMTNIGRSSKNHGKGALEALVTGQQTALAKHSQTAPSSHVAANRPRSYTRDSPVAVRKSPTVNVIESEEQKPESPEEAEIPNEDMNFDVDSDLENFDEEPEAWSLTVEKKMLKRMSKNDIKRQDVILELIQTEGHHVRTLKIMQQVFYRGLNKLANYPAERLDELFPRINDLVDISSRFYRNLRCRQDEAASVHKIGDVIVRQFTGDNGELVKDAYGEFVSKHQEAVALYKHLFKTDKKFSNFIKKCHGHRIVRRLSVPECFTLVTQRMTKYPLLIEAIQKVTKSSHADYKELQKALYIVKDATKSIDNAIKDYEKQSKLKEIKMRFEKGGVVLKGGQKIKNSRFVDYQSKMIHDGVLQWKNARGKLTETHVVLLESMVAFLQENDKKFSLLAIDGKSPCIALNTLMVREVATDKCAIYFVSTSKKGPEMYEFVCSSQKEKRQWCAIISDAIAKAPEDTGDLFHSPEEEKRLMEERLKRRDEILELMKGKDKELSDLVEERNKLVTEMKELMPEGNVKAKEDEKVSSNEKARSILLTAIHRTTHLAADTIHESHSDSELAAATHDKKASSPKRAETFGGFDRRPSQKAARRPTATIPEGKLEENNSSQRRDSGLSLASESVVGLNTLSQAQEVPGNSSFEMLDALQWVLVQFSQQETALESLQVELQSTMEEVRKLRSTKLENDKKHFLVKEEHQSELTRQKKAYSELERTFNTQVSELKLKLSSQQEQQESLLKNFSELRLALTGNR